MSNIAIKIENLSKAYQLGEIGTGTLFPRYFDGAQHDSLSHIAFVSKDVGIVKKNNANDCRNLEADFNEGEADKTAGRESGLWVEASFCLDFLVTFSSRKK